MFNFIRSDRPPPIVSIRIRGIVVVEVTNTIVAAIDAIGGFLQDTIYSTSCIFYL